MRFDRSLVERRRPLSPVVLTAAYLATFSLAVSAFSAEAKPAGSFRIDAWTFDRGNGETFDNPELYGDYRDKYPELLVGDGGQAPWEIEYDINFPVDATYTLHVHYSSPTKRPIEAWLDGRRIGKCCGRITGNAPPYPDRHPPHDRPRDATGFHGLEWEEPVVRRVPRTAHQSAPSDPRQCDGLGPAGRDAPAAAARHRASYDPLRARRPTDLGQVLCELPQRRAAQGRVGPFPYVDGPVQRLL